ncbi:hypothetical protein LCGC14_2437060 [marine sediment metagenome]|uniref:Uncharacterized protein n=1 Tax=marine sediment metagenome TaxID=412755 RepID=A0A0F9DX52_9ZZZZ
MVRNATKKVNKLIDKLLQEHHPTYKHSNGIQTTTYEPSGQLNKRNWKGYETPLTTTRLFALMILLPLTLTGFILAGLENFCFWLRDIIGGKKN